MRVLFQIEDTIMSLPPGLYGRRYTDAERAEMEDHREKPYLLTWADGTQTLAFVEELSALSYARILKAHYGATVTMTGPDYEYHRCADDCGRLFRDGEGQRVGTELLHRVCYAKHPAIVGATMAGIQADEEFDAFNRSRR